MITVNGKQYYTAKQLAEVLKTTKSYTCRLAREGRIRHEKTELGYLFPVETAQEDWDNRKRTR